MKYSVPKKDKEFILIPSIKDIHTLVESNHKLCTNLPFLELRTQLRKSIFKELCEKPIVATGHQPIIYHPGIVFKEMVLNALIKQYGFCGLNLIVDSDALNPDNQYVYIPSLRKGILTCDSIQLFHSEKNLAIEEIFPPDKKEFNQILTYIKKKVEKILPEENLETFTNYMTVTHKAFLSSKNLAQFNTLSKDVFREKLGFEHTEVFLSSICESRAFIYFFSLIVSSCREFVMSYNKILDGKRKQHLSLKLSNDIIELPFWIWKDKEERRTVYIKFNKGKTLICGGDREILDIDNTSIESLIENIDKIKSTYKIRPKALMLTLFARLFLCDLWIHGVGGANYEELNDRLVQEFFSITLPQYAIASATLYLNFNIPTPIITDEEIRNLKNTLREMKFNPEKFLEIESPLVKTKQEIIMKMKNIRYKKELHEQLMVVNDELRSKIISHIQNLEKTILEKERLNKIMTNREFPFFLFSLNSLKFMFEKLIESF